MWDSVPGDGDLQLRPVMKTQAWVAGPRRWERGLRRQEGPELCAPLPQTCQRGAFQGCAQNHPRAEGPNFRGPRVDVLENEGPKTQDKSSGSSF